MIAEQGLEEEEEEEQKTQGLVASLSLGAPVHCPALSVGPEPGPLPRRPAAANTESSSSQHPESSYLPLLTVCLLKLKLHVVKTQLRLILGCAKKKKKT